MGNFIFCAVSETQLGPYAKVFNKELSARNCWLILQKNPLQMHDRWNSKFCTNWVLKHWAMFQEWDLFWLVKNQLFF